MAATITDPALIPSAEHELKFVLPNYRVPAVLQWLRASCVEHAQFPAAIISSIYYDSPDWRLLGEKLDSTFLKTKVRLRWYSDPAGVDHPPGTHIEAKFKTGCQRRKVRIPAPLTREVADTMPLDAAGFAALPRMLREHGLADAARLMPAFQITYTRRRFVHPASGSVFCLDHDIHVPRVNPQRLHRSNPGSLPAAVFEQKGPLDRLSPVMSFLTAFGLKKCAFSKYSRCFKHLINE